ncbi:MAG: hypothetical protein EOP11_06295 [Proteobacteria bacterium]|nr:MAG: hypothetical protein EOP11_06295 [Pseudomonadota bacterium]
MNKKFASRSLSALAFTLGASQVAHAAPDVRIQTLELSEETSLSMEEFEARTMDQLQALAANTNWGGSGGSIHSGNYANSIHAGNYANSIHAGNYADSIHAGNYANSVHAGNYGRVTGSDRPDLIPEPQLAALEEDQGDDR